MKKNLLSIFILSTTFLSAQSNAVEYKDDIGGSVDISGRVTTSLKCTLQPIAPVRLLPVQSNNFTETHLANVDSQSIEIIFSNCDDSLRNIKLEVKNQGRSTLQNTTTTDNNGSNVSVAILDTDGNIIDLSQDNPLALKTNIDQEQRTANYTFAANYKKPEDTEATPGIVTASLNFDVIYSDVARQD
ncbi:fimbrial protein [Proteus columbae]|uniref:fimbrial protein n=1 Tax=Proteus columbae TaxID=1987580 RepID=UPI0013000457|nr:fimbrial protein [Proteus columbae]